MIGIGKIARDQHVPALAGNTRFALAATVSRRETLHSVAIFPDVITIIAADPSVTAASLCTPPSAR
jgi:predicted dehydrogenase